MLPGVLYALEIPKSSLEVVKGHVVAKLEVAQKQNNHVLITKYQAQLLKIEKKIQKFELEWLEYRKHQLEMRSKDPAIDAEISEINTLIRARA